MDNQHEEAVIGKKCNACGHPAGSHSRLMEADLDDPALNENECLIADCACDDFRE